MCNLVSVINASDSYQIGILIFYAIVLIGVVWATLELLVMMTKNVIYHIRTKKKNEKTFKEFNFKPKK